MHYIHLTAHVICVTIIFMCLSLQESYQEFHEELSFYYDNCRLENEKGGRREEKFFRMYQGCEEALSHEMFLRAGDNLICKQKLKEEKKKCQQ